MGRSPTIGSLQVRVQAVFSFTRLLSLFYFFYFKLPSICEILYILKFICYLISLLIFMNSKVTISYVKLYNL